MLRCFYSKDWLVQGVIVAAPVFAATGSRWKAMGIAVASVRSMFTAVALPALCLNHPETIVVQCTLQSRNYQSVSKDYI